MKRIFTTILLSLTALTLASSAQAYAMGSGNSYVDAQTGLTYSLYKPVNTAGLAQTKFSLLDCGVGKEQWVAVRFASGKKTIEVMQTMFGAHCSNPGLAKKLALVTVSNRTAAVYVFCDPAKPAAFKKCGTADIKSVGGYISFRLPGYYKMKATDVEVLATGGITYSQLLAVSRSMTPASTSSSN